VPVRDIDLAVKEVERIAKLGYRTIKIPISVRDRPYNLPDYDPLWSAINDAGMVLSLHAFAESEDRYPADWGEETGIGGTLNHMAMSMVEGMSPVSLLIASGALQRYPDMKFVVVECGAGWLAWLLYLLDEQEREEGYVGQAQARPQAQRILPAPGRGDLQRRPDRAQQHQVHRRQLPAMGQRLSPRRRHIPAQPIGHRAHFPGHFGERYTQDRLRQRGADLRVVTPRTKPRNGVGVWFPSRELDAHSPFRETHVVAI
jgi:hypothetical protein